MGLQRSCSTCDNGGCAVRRPTRLSYLYVLVEEQDEDETEDARHRDGADEQRGEQTVGDGSLWRGGGQKKGSGDGVNQ